MPFKTLQLERDGTVATVTLNRPERRNAINDELIEELLAVFGEISASDTQVIILTGAGKAFCSGMDIEYLRALTSRSEAENRKDSERMARLFRSVYEVPCPTIAVVNGPAVAGGCGLATLCDFTLASTEARFGYTEVRIGFIPAIVSSFLVRQIGEKQARDLLLTGRIIGPEEALRLGLVNEVLAPEQLMPRTRELAAALLENSPASLRVTKHLLAVYGGELDDNIELAVEANTRIRITENFREGVSSFLEKRKPRWSPR